MNQNGFGVLGFFAILCFLGICLTVSYINYQELMVTDPITYQVTRGGYGKMGNDYHDVNQK